MVVDFNGGAAVAWAVGAAGDGAGAVVAALSVVAVAALLGAGAVRVTWVAAG